MLCVIWVEYQRVPVSVLFFCSIEVCDARPPKQLSTWYRIFPRVSKFCPSELIHRHFSSRCNHWVEGSCHVRYMRYTCKNVGKIMALELNQTCYKNAGVCQTLHKITQPKLDSGLYLRKNISFRPSSFSLFNKGLWNKNKRKQKQQRTDSPFSIKGATHLMILMPINNHAKHIRTHQTNLPTSSRFPFVSWPCDPWCYTNWDRSGSACLSRRFT